MDSSAIDEVKARIDIVSLISEYLTLTKKGKNYWANCPFHGEKTPSFSVSPERQIFKCFGCGEGGNAFTFYEKMEGVGFGQALTALAKRAGVTLEKQSQYQDALDAKKEIIFQINQKTADFYHYLLTKHPAGKKALEYLKKRGVNTSSIKDFQLGFAPNDWELLSTYLLKKGFSELDLIASGVSLGSDRGKAPYDRFRNRVMFPVANLAGQTVGFSGRILGDGEPKYLNSPDSLIFNKSNSVYGLYQGKTEMKQKGQAILVEGNLDVISAHQVDTKNVFAPLGTALTSSQLGIIRRFTDRIAFCFDTDSAGVSATKRSIELAENQDFNIKVVALPFGKDPDECIQKDPQSWKDALESATDIYDYILSNLFKKHDTSSSEGKKRIVAEFLPYLAKIQNEITRDVYKEKLSVSLSLDMSLIDRLLGKKNTVVAQVSNPNLSKRKPRQEMFEEYLLALILQSGKYFPEVEKLTFVTPDLHELCLYIKNSVGKSNKIDMTKLAELPKNLEELLDRLTLAQVGEDVLEKEDLLEKELANTLTDLRRTDIKNKLQKLSVEIKQAEITKDDTKLVELRKAFQETSANLVNVSAE